MPDNQESSPAPMTADQGMAQARRRIESARQKKVYGLSLSGLALTTLPESLGTLTALQELDLSSNPHTTLPEWLGNLTQPKSLVLSRNQLTTHRKSTRLNS